MITLDLAPDLALVVSPARAAGILTQLRGAGLEDTRDSAPSSQQGRLVLDDSHPMWEQHTGLLGHDGPEWAFPIDLRHAEAFYRPVTGKARTFIDLLIDHPGALLSVDDICELADGVFTGPRSVAGSINGLLRPQEASGRRYPFYWWAGNPTRYGMKPSVAALFDQARRNLGR